MQAPIAATKFTVYGRVQGVGFRWSTRRVAGELDLAGWARNRPDGSVETWAQGSAEAITQMASFLEQGPAGARVAAVKAEQVEPDHLLEGFQILF